jgi:hypothetical protein
MVEVITFAFIPWLLALNRAGLALLGLSLVLTTIIWAGQGGTGTLDDMGRTNK